MYLPSDALLRSALVSLGEAFANLLESLLTIDRDGTKELLLIFQFLPEKSCKQL